MPIYEYVCKECGTEFEKMVRLSQSEGVVGAPECPRCGSDQTQKQISNFASRLVGQSAGASASSSSSSSCSSSGSRFR